MNFSELQTFLAIVRTKNLTKASELLHATPSTVSYRLKMLEQALGVELVERSKGASQVRLTPSGENFVKLAERWNTLWHETKLFKQSGSQLSLNISVPASLNAEFLVPLYQALYQHEPRIRFRINTQHTEEALDSVARREMDVAFVGRQIPAPSILKVEPFVEEDMVLLKPVEAQQPEGVACIKSLDPEHEVYWNWGATYRRWHDEHWDPAYPRRIQVDMPHLIPALMVDPRQWAVVVKSLAMLFVRSGRFSVHGLSHPPESRTYFKVTHKYPSLSTAQSLDLLDHYLEALYVQGSEVGRSDDGKSHQVDRSGTIVAFADRRPRRLEVSIPASRHTRSTS